MITGFYKCHLMTLNSHWALIMESKAVNHSSTFNIESGMASRIQDRIYNGRYSSYTPIQARTHLIHTRTPRTPTRIPTASGKDVII